MEDQQDTRIVISNLKSSEKFGDNILTGAICLEALKDTRIEKLVYEYKGKRYLNVKVVKRLKPSEYGKTHSILVDMFVPKAKQEVGAGK